MTDLRQAAQQALEALELSAVTVDSFGVQKATQAAITAIRTALEQQAEPPPEWLLIKNILDEYGLDAIAFVAKWQAAQQQATYWQAEAERYASNTDYWRNRCKAAEQQAEQGERHEPIRKTHEI